MFSKKIPASRMAIWSSVALLAPLAFYMGGVSWLGAALLALGCGAVSMLVQRYCTPVSEPFVCLLQWLWLGVLLGSFAGHSAACWDDGSPYPIVPLVLLALAAFGAKDGGAKSSRVGGVLLWFVVPILGIVLAAGTPNVQLQWLQANGKPPLALAGVLLIPCLCALFPRQERKYSWVASLVGGGFLVVCALIVCGSMSPALASKTGNAFFVYCKGISIFGVAERFEAVVACVLTLGWYALFSLMLSAAGHLGENARSGWGRYGVWACAAVAAAVCMGKWYVNGVSMACASLFFWVVAPLLMQYFTAQKKCKKSEN